MTSHEDQSTADTRQQRALLGWVSGGGSGRGPFVDDGTASVEKDLARRLLSGAGLSFLGQALLAGMVGLVAWDALALPTLLTWVVLLLAGAVVRYAVPRRATPVTDADDARRAMRWAAAVSAAAWSGGLLLFAPALSFAQLALLMVVFAGMVAAAVSTMSADPTTFHGFAGVLLGGVFLAVLRHGQDRIHLVAGAMVLLFSVIVVLLVRRSYRTLRAGLETSAELEEHEARAERESSLLTALIQSVPDAIVSMHRDGRILGVNRGFEEVFGWSPSEVLGRDLNELVVPPGERAEAWEIDRELVAGSSVAYEVRRVRKSGEDVHLRASAAPVEGVPDVMVVLYHDITPLKKAERELERAKEAAEAANRAKSEFLATMSHEIRTPMNAIIGMAELLQETDLTTTQRDYVQVFQTAGDTLLSLINEVLDLSKIEAGHLELDERNFDLWDLVDQTVQVFAVPAHRKGLELTAHVDPGVERWVVGDPDRVRQVLVNLLGNAVKFTDEGEVVAEVEQLEGGDDDSGILLRFEVRDTGPGIPEERRRAVFERFTQADSSTTRRHGGTGLGLTISAALVEKMGGEIGVESAEGEGSAFHFTARLEPGEPTEEVPPDADEADVAGLRVLVVDDNATNRLVLREVLQGWGARTRTVPGGREALDELRSASDRDRPYDLVLLDGQMPGMDGFEVADVIREEEDLVKVAMMMLTSTGQQRRHVERAREAGIASYLVKPIRRTRLLQAIHRVLAGAGGGGAGERARRGEVVKEARILLVDDTEENRMLVGAYLKGTAYELETAESGEEAVDTVCRDDERFDLILMDIQMPVMDGYDATRAIRAWEEEVGRDPVPIVALTAHALDAERKKSAEAGMDHHLTKPIKKKELVAAIREWSRKPAGASSGAEGGDP